MDSFDLVFFLSNGTNCFQAKEKEISSEQSEINQKIN